MKILEMLGIEKNKNKKRNPAKIKTDTKKPDKKTLFFMCMKTLLIALVTLGFILTGITAGAAFGYITTSDPVTIEQLNFDTGDTIIYDINGNEIARLNSTDYRNIIPVEYNKVPQYLKDAIVAIEDKRFHSHSGIDFIRTSGAILKMFLGNPEFGGSTITQQLVKNITGDRSNSIPRKIREIWRALQLESWLSKDDILKYYMDIIPLGNNLHGVQAASNAYFLTTDPDGTVRGKDVSELTLAECALLAGITNNPTYYNPLQTTGREHAIGRQRVILNEMKTQEYISEAEYLAALDEEIQFNDNYDASQNNKLSYFAEQVIINVRKDLMNLPENERYTREEANALIYGSGAKIYTTMNPTVQTALDKVYTDIENFPYNKNNPEEDPKYLVQSATVVIDPQTGYISGLYGGYGEKTIGFGLNRATQINRQPGSTLKPILVYGPLIDNDTITLASIFDDIPKRLDSSTNKIYPNNYEKDVFKGPTTVLTALAESNNVIPATLFSNKTYQDYCLEYLAKLGIDIRDEKHISTALGGLSKGINPLDLAAAYVPFANNGFYYSPICYTKVVDNKNKTIIDYTDEQKADSRFSLVCENEATPLIMTEAMKKVVSEGTAKGLIDIKDNNGGKVEAAGKTGTTNNYKDSWFVGYTPSYVAATWYGFDDNNDLTGKDRTQSTVIWNKVMQEIHKNMDSVSFSNYSKSSVVEKKICKYSGLLATEACSHELRDGKIIDQTSTIYFAKNSKKIPATYCTSHIAVCKTSNGRANDNCPEIYGIIVNRPIKFEAVNKNDPEPQDLKYIKSVPKDCTVHSASHGNDPEPSTEPGVVNTSPPPSQGTPSNSPTKSASESPSPTPSQSQSTASPSPSPSEPDNEEQNE